MSSEPEGTTIPPLVLFGRYGSNNHCRRAGDDNHRFVVADMSETRARKVNKKPSLLGYGTRNGSKAAKNQEQKWINLSTKDEEN